MTDEEYMEKMLEHFEQLVLQLIGSFIAIVEAKTGKSEKEIIEYMKRRAVSIMGLN